MADDADHLYSLPLEEFVAARDAAAKALRKAGDREAAAALAKLPKPTPAAWAANQVARRDPDVLDAFLAAGTALRDAQQAALAGDAGALRDATKAQRAAVDAFVDAARPLKPAGRSLSRATSDRLRTTLLAAAGNEELSDALAEGRLALEAEAGGAWPPPDAEDVAAAPRREKPASRRKDDGRKLVRDTNKRATRAAAKRAGGAAAERGEGTAAGRGQGTAAERDHAAARERAEAKERERAQREAARARRQALERELREARGALKVHERALIAAEKDARRAAHRLDVALAEAEDARVEAEAMRKILAEARDAVESIRDAVARLEER